MKRKAKRNALLILTGVILLCLFWNFGENSEETEDDETFCYTYGNKQVEDTRIVEQKLEGQRYLFLPSGIDLKKVHLFFSCSEGQKFYLNGKELKKEQNVDLTKEASYDGEADSYLLHLALECDGKQENYDVNIMASEQLKSFYITSDDVVNYGKAQVDEAEDYSEMATGSLCSLGAGGNYLMSQKIEAIRVHGNTTTRPEKKAYQFKLKKKEDLLGISEPAKNWVLLANAYDATLQHNLVAYQLGKEIGIESSPDCEPIDLYYDGEYIGNYLLSEKVEVNNNRVNVTETVNKQNSDEEVITAWGKNQYGDLIQYVKNVEEPEEKDGGYLLQLDIPHYQEKNSFFSVNDSLCFGMESPKNCSLSQMQYVSEVWHELEETVENEGVHPDTGKTIEDYLDIDSFAKYYLVQQLAKNPDGFSSSTYCYIPKGEEKVYFCAPWDFDISYGIEHSEMARQYADFLDPEGLYPTGVISEIAGIPVVQQKIKETEEKFFDIVENILLSGKEEGTYLKSLQAYEAELEASQRMNYTRWPGGVKGYYPFVTYEDSVEYFRNFLESRNEWLYEEIASWNGTDKIDSIELCVEQPLDGMPIEPKVELKNDFSGAQLVSVTCDTKDTYFRKGNDYTYCVVLKSRKGICFKEDLEVKIPFGEVKDISVESEEKAVIFLNPGTPRVTDTVYNGVDYASVYDKDYYLSHYPEVAANTNGSDKAVLKYYVENGIHKGHQANEEFSIQYYIARYPFLETIYGDDYEQIVLHYINEGRQDGMSGKPD